MVRNVLDVRICNCDFKYKVKATIIRVDRSRSNLSSFGILFTGIRMDVDPQLEGVDFPWDSLLA